MSEKQDFAKSATLGVAGTQPKGLELSDVVFVRTERITPHPENTSLFREEDDQYFERLRDDVKERGILVPLILKADDTLLAGHNRLRVAQELGLKTVPAQYLEAKLTEQQEREFLIKDNLYRRQLGREEWLELYRKLFPNFDQRIEIKSVGRKPKESTEEIPQDGGIEEEVKPLTAKEIAKVTGQKERTVQHQLKKHREAGQVKELNEVMKTGRDIRNDISFAFRGISNSLANWLATKPSQVEKNEILTLLLGRLTDWKERVAEDIAEEGGQPSFSADGVISDIKAHFSSLYLSFFSWESSETSKERKAEVYSALQASLDRLQDYLTIRQQEVE